MTSQLLSLRQQRSAIPAQANQAIAAIATLNQKIIGTAAGGSNTSALVDARDQAIDTLASFMALEVTNQPDGSLSVSLKSGPPLVIGGLGGTISVAPAVGGGQTITLRFVDNTFNLDNVSMGGQMGGLSDFERQVLLPLQQSVADVAENLADSFNTQSAAGFDVAGNPGPPLFVFNAIGSGAPGLLQLSAGFKATDLAFSNIAGSVGNSDNLLQLIGLKTLPISVGTMGLMLLGDADTQLVGKLGIDSQQNQAALGTADTVRSQSVADWQATSGVNRDEEAINLVEFQNMYQANMKVISVANTLFDATLEMMR
jgi:flagellar hook-associated protein 1 FlgK